MSLQPASSQDVDPLLLNTIQTEEVDGDNWKFYSNIVIKKEVDSDNGCDPSLQQIEEVNVKSESILVQDKVHVDMSLLPTPSQDVDLLLLNTIKTEEVENEVSAKYGESWKFYSNIVVKEEIDLDDRCDPSSLQTDVLIVKSENNLVQNEEFFGVSTNIQSTANSGSLQSQELCKIVCRNCKKIVTCATCVDVLHNHTNMFNHTCTHANVYLCNDCNSEYKRKTEVEMHVVNTGTESKKNCHQEGSYKNNNQIHEKDEGNSCTNKGITHEKSISNELCVRESVGILETHENICLSIKPYKCKYCKKAFHQLIERKKHENAHTANIKQHKCKHCEKTFSQLGHLKRHKTIHTGIRPHKCKYCEKAFSRLDHLRAHENIHTSLKPHKCKTCEKTFTQLDSLKTHETTHTNTKLHKCKYCEKVFNKLGNLKAHENIHTGIKPHKCKYCEKTFTQFGTLNAHETTHTGIKPHRCNYCEKSFTRLGHLKTHETIHTGIKPYKCKYCEKTFRELSYLKTHENIHTGLKPHKCKFCEKTFRQVGHLKTHETIHTGIKPYKCKYCEKEFRHLLGLKSHEQVHTGIKSHKCKYCEKAFTQLSSLKNHENIHVGNKPHKCKYCGKAFTQLGHLKQHANVHTGISKQIFIL